MSALRTQYLLFSHEADNIYLALPEILHLIRADKQNQMPQSHSIHNGMRTNLDGSKTSIQYI